MLGVSDSDLLGNSVWSFEGGVVGVVVGDQDGTIILAVLGEVLGEDEGVLYDATC